MSDKPRVSLKTKKILTGIGISFGTVMVFLISFILAFSLIVNPINFFTVSDADTVKENEQLKEKVQSLTDEVEILNTTVDKYKASGSAPATVTTPEEQPSTQTTDTASGPQTSNSEGTQTSENSGAAESETDGNDFTPDTVTSTDQGTPEDVEEPITVIDISE